jgi:hypothetical protein
MVQNMLGMCWSVQPVAIRPKEEIPDNALKLEKNMKLVFIVIAFLFLSGCAGRALDRGYSPSLLTDDQLLLRVLNGLVIPLSYRLYADDIRVERSQEIELDDVVEYRASCVTSELRENATTMDLEVIYGLWVKGDGRAKDAIITSLGRQAYLSGVEAYSNANFDCELAVSRWLDQMNG